jgi:hypothetical protein
VHLLEIRFRGRAGGRGEQKEEKEFLRNPKFRDSFRYRFDNVPGSREAGRLTVAELKERVTEMKPVCNPVMNRQEGIGWP